MVESIMLTPDDQALAFLCNSSFHQSLWIPPTTTHGRMRVTFATTTNFSDHALPIILYCGPMFGSRWSAVDFDNLAKQTGVRCICIDRPGRGGSHPTSPLDTRIPIWLKTIPLVLKQLHIQHLNGLFSHSAGTMYALNTIYHLRHLLSPKKPMVAMIAPFVVNEHSSAPLTNFLVKLPDDVVRASDPLMRFINQRIVPVTNWGENMLKSSSGIIGFNGGSSSDQGSMTVADKYGTTEEVGRNVEKWMRRFLLAEDTSGSSEEALLCLRKGQEESWGVAQDYETFVSKFAADEKRRGSGADTRLEVKVWYAENDVMSGKGGQSYFEACWRKSSVDEVIDFDSVVLKETGHDSIMFDQKRGALQTVFELFGKKRGNA